MTSYYSPITYIIPPEEDGWLLKTILHKRMDISRKLLSRLKMTEQGIMVNGERVYISVKIQTGDIVEIRMETEVSEDILPQPIPFESLYEDEHLLVVNKAAGIIVHPTHGHYTDTLANGIVHYWAEKGERYRFRPVHRLDQETSGVLVIAKNPFAHQHISEQMIAGTVDKRYTAFVHGVPAAPEGDIDGPIDRDPAEPHRRIVTPEGYPSLTRYKVMETYSGGSRVELKLETGRTHQIRVHMTSIGCPLIGDGMYRHPLYSETVPTPAQQAQLAGIAALDAAMPRQALHAVRLSLRHPVLPENLIFEAPLPPDMAALERELKQGKPKPTLEA
ncbi:RluA family pseudouridine synthase [Paenibacillus agri]|uniref:Pseudouridine synthase n=1 Tax=Paenibacillus agri TaxID=2744309 RepID=A0A850EW98_9BACL|nr:RluA family pseudouridine synthase [Paenibacillus agri]NUU63744.1 RluA family pseudouridine synthase [Paenibacillus agri]